MKLFSKNILLYLVASIATTIPLIAMEEPAVCEQEPRQEIQLPLVISITLDEQGKLIASQTKILNPADVLERLHEEFSQLEDQPQHNNIETSIQYTDGEMAKQAAKLVLNGVCGLIILGWIGTKLVLIKTGEAAWWVLQSIEHLTTSEAIPAIPASAEPSEPIAT